jgi:hypothetical protein
MSMLSTKPLREFEAEVVAPLRGRFSNFLLYAQRCGKVASY